MTQSDEVNDQKRLISIRTEQGGFLGISLFAPVLDFLWIFLFCMNNIHICFL